MRYLMFFMALFALTACHKPAPPPKPVPTTAIASVGSMRVSHPLVWENMLDNEDQKVYMDNHRHALLILSKEECTLSYGACMVFFMRGIASAGFNHLSADDVVINETKYVLLVSHNGKNKLWTWLSLRDKEMYTLTCGGMETDATIEQDCLQIGESLNVHETTTI